MTNDHHDFDQHLRDDQDPLALSLQREAAAFQPTPSADLRHRLQQFRAPQTAGGLRFLPANLRWFGSALAAAIAAAVIVPLAVFSPDHQPKLNAGISPTVETDFISRFSAPPITQIALLSPYHQEWDAIERDLGRVGQFLVASLPPLP